jgi:hypothetical protein
MFYKAHKIFVFNVVIKASVIFNTSEVDIDNQNKIPQKILKIISSVQIYFDAIAVLLGQLKIKKVQPSLCH